MKKMNTIKLLKGLNYLWVVISIVLIIIFIVNLLSHPLYVSDGRFFILIPHLTSIPLLLVFSIIISLKTHQQKGVLLFAGFLSLISIDWLMQFIRLMDTELMPYSWLVIANAVTGTVYIKALQSFPRQISKHDIISVFPKNKIAAGYLNWAIKDYTWLIFPIILTGCSWLKMDDSLSDALVSINALLCMYVNFKKSSALERNKILWLFWGVVTFSFLLIIHLIFFLSATELSGIVRLSFNASLMLVLIVSLVMSLFFSDTFDTGVLIRRTLVDGFIFIIIVLIYNTIEHYFLHWLSHELEISDVILSSLLSGIFVLAFSPIHHKLMGFLEKRIKKNHAEHTDD